MKEKRPPTLILQVTKSTAIIAVILFIVMFGINWNWALGNHYLQQETLWKYFERCMIISSFFIGIQVAVLFVASIIAAIIRGQHSMVAGSLSGIVIMVLNSMLIAKDFHHHDKMPGIGVLIGVPLLVTALQFCPVWKNRKALNNSIKAPPYGAPHE